MKDDECSATFCNEYGIDQKKLPQHIAIIMDGNGRWAKKRFQPRFFGHRAGMKAVKESIKACLKFGISHLSLYAFSTENWKRPKAEVQFLMELMNEFSLKELPELKKNGVNISCIGNIDALPASTKDTIYYIQEQSKDNNRLYLHLHINYGSRAEIVKACQRIATDASEKKINIDDIDEPLFASYLDTYTIPDPDILIRTSHQYRLSNFLLWQLSYSELFFIDTLWPDFNLDHLAKIIKDFQKRHRRYGGV